VGGEVTGEGTGVNVRVVGETGVSVGVTGVSVGAGVVGVTGMSVGVTGVSVGVTGVSVGAGVVGTGAIVGRGVLVEAGNVAVDDGRGVGLKYGIGVGGKRGT